MKSTIIIVIAVFVITANVKTVEGIFPFGRKCCGSGYLKKPHRREKADENKKIMLVGNSTSLLKHLHPAFVKRKICCLCKMPLCVCKICENPDSWFGKTLLRAERKQAKDETSSPKPENVTDTEADVKGNSTITRVPSLRKYNDIQSKNSPYESKYNKGGLKLQCECMRCKLCSTGKCGVILKCDCCGPMYLNGTSKKINFSKLLFKMNNKLNVNTKFLEINQ